MDNESIKVFVGSSSEGLEIAKRVQQQLHSYSTRIWPDIWKDGGFFSPSKTTMEQLITSISKYDFAVFIFSPDDIMEMRGTKAKAIRDNVLFELGLFIGGIGLERNFIIAPDGMDFHIPTDLLGYSVLTYNEKWLIDGDSNSSPLGPACSKINDCIDKLGSLKVLQTPFTHSAALCYRVGGTDLEVLLIKSRCGNFRGFPKHKIAKHKDESEAAADAAHVEGGVLGVVDFDLGSFKYQNTRGEEAFVSAFALKVTTNHGSCESFRQPEWFNFDLAITELAVGRSRFYAEEILSPVRKLRANIVKN